MFRECIGGKPHLGCHVQGLYRRNATPTVCMFYLLLLNIAVRKTTTDHILLIWRLIPRSHLTFSRVGSVLLGYNGSVNSKGQSQTEPNRAKLCLVDIAGPTRVNPGQHVM